MGDPCFNCGAAATETVTLVLGDGTILADKPLCGTCVTDFRADERLEVHDAPVFTRGASDEDRDPSN